MSRGPKRRPPTDPRLRNSRIETVAKKVLVMPGMDKAGVASDPALRRELLAIVNSIEQGRGVPEAHYRSGIDTDRDRLLDEHGVVHIHLQHKGSDVLVYLVQYDETVVIVRTGTHAELQHTPPSSLLRDIRRGLLNPYDAEAIKIRMDLANAKAEVARLRAEQLSGSRAAALKRLKTSWRRRRNPDDDE